jgi:hypothetical protein
MTFRRTLLGRFRTYLDGDGDRIRSGASGITNSDEDGEGKPTIGRS